MNLHFRSRALDDKGKQLISYHATTATFSAFRLSPSEAGIHFGSSVQANERMKKTGQSSGIRMIQALLSIRNPIIVHDDIFNGVPYPTFAKMISDDVATESGKTVLNKKSEDFIMARWSRDFEKKGFAYTSNDAQFYRDIENCLKQQGNDAIFYFNDIESDFTQNITDELELYSWCVLDPSQIRIIK